MMTEVSKIIQQIARQQFLPDATRSGRFLKVVEKADGGAGTCHDEEAAEADDYDGAEGGDSSDESSDAGGPHEECDEVPGSTPLLHFVPTELRPYLVVVDPALVAWRNKASLLVLLAKQDEEKLLCGDVFLQPECWSGEIEAWRECPRC